jgi:enoyl-CoA hydratase/carnithine racemase
LSAALVEALLTATREAFEDACIQHLVLRGAGPHFCTGLDLSDLGQTSDGDLLHRLVRIEILLAQLWHAPIATTVVAHGRTWGAGADLFATGETRWAHPQTTFRFPGAQFGIVLGSRRLAEHIGSTHARRLITQGEQCSATQALDWGLATHLGAEDEDAEATLATIPAPWTLGRARVTREVAHAVRNVTRADHRDADLAALVRSASQPGLRDRIQAYVQQLRG